MTDWWSALPLELQVFYVIGITALLVTVVQTTLTLIGIGGDALDIEIDLPEDGHSTGIGLFSVQTISAFFLGFGWGGVVALEMGWNLFIAVVIAFNLGGLLMAAMYFLLVGLLSLQARGNRDYGTAVGATAEVYVTIPANRGGNGQIQVLISGRVTTADAMTDDETDLKPGQHVKVIDLVGKSDYLVESL